MLMGVILFGCALHRLIHKSFVTTAHRARELRDFDFLVAGPWYGPVLTDHLRAGAWLQMTCAHNFFRLYALVICDHCPPAQGNVDDLDFVSAVPHSYHHTVGAASWQNHDSQQYVIILHCHICLCLSNTYISSALWRQAM